MSEKGAREEMSEWRPQTLTCLVFKPLDKGLNK